MGDFNFAAPERPETAVRAPSQEWHGSMNHARRQRAEGSRWTALADLTELMPNAHSRYADATGTFSTLDRMFTAAPSWAILQTRGATQVYRDPDELHRNRISDHACVWTRLYFQPPPDGLAPIHHAIFKTKAFAEKLEELTVCVGLRDLVGEERWATHKDIIQVSAAFATRAQFCNRDPKRIDEPLVRNAALSQLAKVVMANNKGRAEVLIELCKYAKEHLCIDGNSNKVALKRPEAFA